jgi:hypothetical protein
MKQYRLKDLSTHLKKTIGVQLAEIRSGVSLPLPLLALEVVASIQLINNLI